MEVLAQLKVLQGRLRRLLRRMVLLRGCRKRFNRRRLLQYRVVLLLH